MRYLEFAVASNFSFLRGASHPEELVVQAAHAGLAGIGLTDRNSVAGVVRAHLIKRAHPLPLRFHPGTRLVFADGTPDILAYPRARRGLGALPRLLTVGNRRADKGECILYLDDLIAHVFGLELVVLETSSSVSRAQRSAKRCTADPGPRLMSISNLVLRVAKHLRSAAPGRVRLAATMHYRGRDRARLAARAALTREMGVPLIPANDVA